VGRETTLRDNIYDLQATQSDQFTKTTKEIANYVGRTFTKYTGALVTSGETLSLPMPVEPTDPDPTNPVLVNKYKDLYSAYIKKTPIMTLRQYNSHGVREFDLVSIH
jgi:hypothetical protein